jgi:hypothetical protein
MEALNGHERFAVTCHRDLESVRVTNCGKKILSLPFRLATARQQLKDKTVASLVCVFTGHRVVARKNNQVTRMNGLTSHNNIPCMIMDVVEVGAIIGLVAWNRKRRHQRRQFWVHPIYSFIQVLNVIGIIPISFFLLQNECFQF